MLTIFQDSLRLPVVPDYLDPSAQDQLKGYVVPERFGSIRRESITIGIPRSAIPELYPLAKAAHLQYVELAAGTTATGSSYAKAHRPSILDFLESRLGREMPKPEYQLDPDTSYWKIAPGPQAKDWDEWREGGCAAIEWPLLGDVSAIEHGEFEHRRQEAAAKTSAGEYTQQGTSQVWRFLDIREGDYVLANRGTTEVVGLGAVKRRYYFVNGVSNPHHVDVDWFDDDVRKVDKPTWIKTFMSMTKAEYDEIAGQVVVPLIYTLEQLAAGTRGCAHRPLRGRRPARGEQRPPPARRHPQALRSRLRHGHARLQLQGQHAVGREVPQRASILSA